MLLEEKQILLQTCDWHFIVYKSQKQKNLYDINSAAKGNIEFVWRSVLYAKYNM